MQLRFLFLWCLLVVLVVLQVEAGGGGGGGDKHVKVYVPYNVKTIKHTHTIYKTIHHQHPDEGKEEPHDHGPWDLGHSTFGSFGHGSFGGGGGGGWH